ncbi:MAG: transglutaminase-like domain-containing protein [Nitrospinota bacterium]
MRLSAGRGRWFPAVLVLLALGGAVWGVGRIPLTTQVGVNYDVAERRVTLSEKAAHFLSRHLAMRRLAREITEAKETPVEKALAMHTWVVKNILPGENVRSLPVTDDHPLSIVTRGYGTGEQRADLFSVLCGYAGIPAALYLLRHPESGEAIVLAVVQLAGVFHLFDPARDNLFFLEGGRMAGLADLRKNPELAAKARNQPKIRGIPYADYFSGIHPVPPFPRYLRADLQRPFPRILYQAGRLLGWVKPPPLFF